MKLGLGLYRHMLTSANFQFARQAGATHLVVHLVDYFHDSEHGAHDNQPTGASRGWGRAGDPDKLWELAELLNLKQQAAAEGLTIEAIENFDPAHWSDVLLGGPRKRAQLENLKTIVRRVGEAGIPIIGYNFSIAGVCGRMTGPFARGGALSVGMEGPFDEPMPHGMAWNMVVDADALQRAEPEPAASSDQLWDRLGEFLDELVPVAEEAGVRLAAHPDDPPMPSMRGQPRLVYQPRLFDKQLSRKRSPANALEFCVGTIAEMTDGGVYDAVDKYSRQGAIAYVHLRNVTGTVPNYRETFIDDGDVDVLRVLKILKANGFDGVIIPDHAPQMTCGAPWHAGMAFALGYLHAALDVLEREPTG